jgi:hypothetical protein
VENSHCVIAIADLEHENLEKVERKWAIFAIATDPFGYNSIIYYDHP